MPESDADRPEALDSREPFISKCGEVITDELAERIADEAEAGYSLEQITNVRSGPRRSLIDRV